MSPSALSVLISVGEGVGGCYECSGDKEDGDSRRLLVAENGAPAIQDGARVAICHQLPATANKRGQLLHTVGSPLFRQKAMDGRGGGRRFDGGPPDLCAHER